MSASQESSGDGTRSSSPGRALSGVPHLRLVDPFAGVNAPPLAAQLRDACEQIFSRVITASPSEGGSDMIAMQLGLLAYGTKSADEDRDALWESEPPHGPGLEAALRRLGITRAQLIDEVWHGCRGPDRPDPRLPAEIVDAIIWAPSWEALGSMVRHGPAIAANRVEWVLEELARSPAPITSARPGGGRMSKSTVDNRGSAYKRIFRAIKQVASRGLCPEALADWAELEPTFRLPRAEPANTDRGAPSLSELRALFVKLERDCAARLRRRPGESDLDALARLPDGELSAQCLFRALRRLAVFLIFVVIGARSGAVARLKRSDLIVRHEDPDGNVGPALALHPGKGRHADDIEYKPLPAGLNQCLVVYEAAMVRLCRARGTEWPMDALLFPTSTTRPWAIPRASSFSRIFAGEWVRDRRGMRRRRPGLLAGDGRPGRTAHTLRHACTQLVRRGAGAYCAQHGLHGASAEDIADALLSHQSHSDKLHYFDLAGPRGRERWSRHGAAIAWEVLTGPLGAPRTRDVPSYRRVIIAIERLGDERRALLASPERETWEVIARVTEIGEGIQRLEFELHYLRYDPAALVAFDPDTMPAGVVLENVQARDQEFIDEYRRLPPSVRDWVTLEELARLAGIALCTLHRFLARRAPWPRDREALFAPGVPPAVDEGAGFKRRRILVGELSPAFRERPEIERALADLLATWPKGWSVTACEAPFRDLAGQEQR